MEVKNVIVTVLIFVIVLAIATVALNMLTGDNNVTIYKKDKTANSADVSLFVEGGQPIVNNDRSTIGLYVEGGK